MPANPEAYLEMVERERDAAFGLLRRVKATGKLSDMTDDVLLDEIDALLGDNEAAAVRATARDRARPERAREVACRIRSLVVAFVDPQRKVDDMVNAERMLSVAIERIMR